MTLSALGGIEMRLELKYQGWRADRGRLNALEVGPAIFGMGQTVGDAARVLYGDSQRVRVEVRADFEHASFGVEFVAVSDVGALVSSLSLADLANIAQILGFSGGTAWGVVRLIKWLRGRRITSVARTGDTYSITTEDNSTTNITVNVYRVFADTGVRDGLKAITRPLEQEGVDQLEIRAEDREPVIIEKTEQAFFKSVTLPEEEVAVDTGRHTLEVVSPVFREDNSWRFSAGGGSFWARVADEKFLAEVGRHRTVFGRGDLLRVEMETRTYRQGTDLTYRRVITHVYEHISAESDGGQLDLVPEATE